MFKELAVTSSEELQDMQLEGDWRSCMSSVIKTVSVLKLEWLFVECSAERLEQGQTGWVQSISYRTGIDWLGPIHKL